MFKTSIKDILGPLTFRNFQLFIFGHFISFTGSWMQTTTLHWLIYNQRHSTLDLGYFSFLTTFPAIFLTFLSGFLTDRFERKRFLQILLFLALFPPSFMGILLYFNYFNLWVFIFLAFLGSALSSIDMPLRQVFISEIVPTCHLTKALSMQALSFNLARILGPVIAGYLIVNFPIILCFFFNALSFLPLLIALKFIKPLPKKEHKLEKITLSSEIKDFLVFFKENKEILYIVLILANFTFFATSIIILLPMFVVKVLHSSAKDFAYLSSGVGIGAIAGALSVFLQREAKKELYYLIRAHLLWSLGVVCFIFGKTFMIYLIGSILIGFSFTNFFPIVNAYLQKRTPLRMRGKMMSLFSIAFLGAAPLGQSLLGFLADFMPYQSLLSFMLFILITINLYFLTKILNFRKKLKGDVS